MYFWLGHLVNTGFNYLLNLTFSLPMKDEYEAETPSTIRLIEASLGREDVADRANFRYTQFIPTLLFLFLRLLVR